MALSRSIRVLGVFAAGAAVALLAALAVRGWHPAARQEAPIIRSYSVRPDIAREVYGVVSEALHPNMLPALGGVSLAPGGRLIVTAPPRVQAGVEQTLAQIAEQKPTPTPSIAFDLWLVSGRRPDARAVVVQPGAAKAGSTGAAATELAEVSSALEELRKSRGPLDFQLLEKLSLVARAGEEDSRVSSAHSSFQVRPTLMRAEDGSTRVAAEIQVQARSGASGTQLKSLVELRPGQLLVVGESAGSGQEPDGGFYYIVRARL